MDGAQSAAAQEVRSARALEPAMDGKSEQQTQDIKQKCSILTSTENKYQHLSDHIVPQHQTLVMIQAPVKSLSHHPYRMRG